MMKYAEVAVDAPAGYNRTFTYSIPPGLDISPGHLVQIPFGPRVVPGIVFRLSNESPVRETRPISGASRDQPVLSPVHLALAEWISDYYMAPLFECAALMMPPGLRERSLTHYSAAAAPADDLRLSPAQRRVMDYLAARTRVERGALLRALGLRVDSAIGSLARRGLIEVSTEWRQPSVRPRYVTHLELANQVAAADSAAELERRASRQAALLRYLSERQEPVPRAEAVREFGASAVGGLEKKGLVRRVEMHVERDPLRGREYPTEEPPVLTPDQQRCVSAIESAIDNTPPRVFLLHGVTGSGKTEVYLRALEHAISRGKRGIVLAPELALTPQTIDRFSRRFPGQVAVQHSGLSPGERFDQWWRIREGRYGVAIGARSALFAPQPDLGLIVIDEEHEPTYKQEDAPRYHARDAALKLAELTGAVVVLGTATPDVVTYSRAVNRRYRLLELPERIADGAGTRSRIVPQPPVQIVDLRRELEEGNRSIFSRALTGEMDRSLKAGEQVILYLNRRGSGSMVQCRDCGHVMRCGRCDFTLTHHAQAGKLLCHQCNYSRNPPRHCPKCRSRQIRYLGLGTQRVVEELEKEYPGVRSLRWDRDATSARGSHQRIMEAFLRGDAQVLVGTQMIAKGLHFPNVTLVGVLCADIGLFLPDFHAGERVFQLLCQVSGRTGRGPLGGKVVVQTYSPDHYAVTSASAHDYSAFYDSEMAYRREQALPPYERLIRLVYTDLIQDACRREAVRMGDELKGQSAAWGLTNTDILGPAPAFPPRLRGRYRWHVILRGQDPRALLDKVQVPQGWVVDVDPMSVA